MYTELVGAINASKPEDLSVLPQKHTQAQKLDVLLKNGKLLSNCSNDGSTTLENLYKALTTPRLSNLSSVKIVNQTIDALFDPTIITQKFGDIPEQAQELFLSHPKTSEEVKQNPESMHVTNSGTCVAASIEFHLANKHPSEFARWIQELSSPALSVKQTINMSSLSKNFLDAIWLLDAFKLKTTELNFERANLVLEPDDQVILRALLQDNFQDPDERSIVDVLMQSTILNIGSQKTYNSLTDVRKGDFNSSPQGLIEFEKTFVESIIENKEKLSIVYQNIDENNTLMGYRCGFDKIEEHIKKTIASGEDVIIGYIVLDEEGKTLLDDEGRISGHEITIADVKKDKHGETIFVCNDTDDGKNHLIEYPASWLLPRIHHAGYPASIVENEHELLYDWVEPQATAA